MTDTYVKSYPCIFHELCSMKETCLFSKQTVGATPCCIPTTDTKYHMFRYDVMHLNDSLSGDEDE